MSERLEDTIYETDKIKRNGSCSRYTQREIVKHSKNIIDLIKVGDFVNEHKIADEIYGEDDNDLYFEIEGGFNKARYISEKEVETILTYEQYEQNCYRLEK